jgi:hypothetical protein
MRHPFDVDYLREMLGVIPDGDTEVVDAVGEQDEIEADRLFLQRMGITL